MKKQSNQYYLESAPITKSILHLSVPMMIGMSVGTIYNIINAYFIGLLHNTNMMSAITLGLPIFTILMAIGNVFGVGGGTFISRSIGEGKTEKAKNIAGYALWGSVITGVIVAAIAFILLVPITHALGADMATFQYTKDYTAYLFIGGFIIIANFALEQIVRSEGASKESMYGVFISSALSLLLDPIFILVLHWDVKGAAIAMSLANLGAVIYYVYFLETKSENLKGFMKHIRLSAAEQLEVYKIGASELFQSAFLVISTLLLNHYAIEYGDKVIASFGIALRIVQLPEFLAMGLFLGLIPFIAFNFGKKNWNRLFAGIRQAFIWIGIITGVFVGIVSIFRESIFRLFSQDNALIEVGVYILVAMLISALFNGFTGLFTGVFQATGQGTMTTIMSVTQGLLFIPVIVILHYLFGLHGVIWAMTITEVITCLLGAFLYLVFTHRLRRNKKALTS